jgi:hypothetical protein
MERRRNYKILIFVSILLLLVANFAHAQNPFEDAIKQLTSDNAKGYLQPFVSSFGANLNSGLYHSANIGELGFALRFDIVSMATLIGDAEKKYKAVAPQPFSQEPVGTATIFGDLGTVVKDPVYGMEYQFQNGQVKTDYVFFASPQLTIGDVYHSQVIIRYVPIPKIEGFPKVTLFGIGGRHNVSHYFPVVPLDVAASIYYQTFDIGDIFQAKTFNFGAQASKTFSVLTLYGGLQYETSSMDVSYTYEGEYGATKGTKMNLSMDGDNHFRFTAGLNVNLFVLNLFADVNIGSMTMFSGGLGFGF